MFALGHFSARYWCFLLLLAFTASPSHAQLSQPSTNGSQPATNGNLTVPEVQTRLAAVEAATDIDETAKAELRKQYNMALEWLKAADQSAQRIQEFQDEIANAPNDTKAARESRDRSPVAYDADVQQLRQKALPELETLLKDRQRELQEAQDLLAKREIELRTRERKQELTKLAADNATQLDAARKSLAAPAPPNETAAATLARRTELQARVQMLERAAESYRVEGDRIEKVSELLLLRQNLAQRDVNWLDQRVQLLQTLVDDREKLEADRTAEEALFALENAPPAVREIAAENARLTEARASMTGKLKDVSQEVDAKIKTLAAIAKDMDRAVQKVKAAGLSSTVGLMLRKERNELPDIAELEERLAFIQDEMPIYELRSIDLDEALTAASDPEKYVKTILEKLPATTSKQEREQIERMVREETTKQIQFLNNLKNDYDEYLEHLSNLEISTRQLIDKVVEFERYINERILWIRSTGPLTLDDFQEAWKGLLAVLSPKEWINASKDLIFHVASRPLRECLVLLALFFLFFGQQRMRGALRQLSQPAAGEPFLSFNATFRAAVLTLLISIVWPALLFLISWRLTELDHPSLLTRAIAIALKDVAISYWFLETVRQVFRPSGFAEAHLAWDPNYVKLARQNVRMLMVIGLPFVMAVSMFYAYGSGDSLGRLTFIAALIVFACVFAWLGFSKSSVIHRLIEANPERLVYRYRYVLFTLVITFPLVLVVLSIFGFDYSAFQLSVRFFATGGLLVAVVLLRGAFARWLFIRQCRLARRRAEQRAEEEEKALAAAESTTVTEVVPVEPQEAIRQDEEDQLIAIDRQLQQLLRLAMFLALFIGGWLIWHDMLPALRRLDNIKVWPGDEVAAQTETQIQPAAVVAVPDGSDTTATDIAGVTSDATSRPAAASEATTKPMTWGNLLATMMIAIITIVAGRNIPGLLEIILLERLPLDGGARNAVTTVVGYIIMGTGVIVAFKALGIAWENVQWFAAAVTVGLGFGLQEIFANFVSGVILLFERPIRVGDVITLGDVTGTVTRIRIRATTITNWDRQELVVPNKDLITGRLLNWTLSDRTNRLVITVGVAYGSDLKRVRQLLLSIASSHAKILDDPAPSVTFETFGDSTLNFIVRCYLSSLADRLPACHELNSAIHDCFAREGIEIAFPQRDLHIRSMPPQMAAAPSTIDVPAQEAATDT